MNKWIQRSLSFLALALFVIEIGIAYSQSTTRPADSMVQVTVHPSSPPLSTFMGLGIEFDPYQFQPPADRWKTILERVSYASPGFFRVMSSASDYCLGFDAAGNPIYVWNHPDAATQQRLDKLTAILDFAQKQGIDVFLGEWSPPRELGIKDPADPRWARMIADFVQYLVREKHYTVIHHYIFFNEPNGQWMWPHSSPDFTAWSTGIKNLRRDFDARGLNSVTLAGPDNSGDPAWFDSSVKSLNTQFGSWECHIYATDAEVYGSEIQSMLSRATTAIMANDPRGQLKERFVAESGLQDGKNNELDQQPRVRTFQYGVLMADYVAQVAQAGWMGADAWDLDDAMHGNRQGGLKLWGFWDSSDKGDMSVRPWFYTWSLMSRFFPKGSQVLKVESQPPTRNFRVMASEGKSHDRQQSAIMLVNDADRPLTVFLRFPLASPQIIYRYDYFQNDRPVDPFGMPQLSGASRMDLSSGVTVEMPSRGVVFLTSRQP